MRPMRGVCGAGKRSQYRHRGKTPKAVETRTLGAISGPTKGMQSSDRLRSDNWLHKEDGHANCKERKCPRNLVEVEQDAALHVSLLDLDCHGCAWTVLSGKLCEV